MGPEIKLLPLTDAEYAEFAECQVTEVARQHVNAGEWPTADAPARAREECTDLLADVLRDVGHIFYKGVDFNAGLVGWLWVAPAPRLCEQYGVRDVAVARWLAQITVAEPLRYRGYGLALLDTLHHHLAIEGVAEIYLRVYDWNHAARRLYARTGYEIVRQFATDAHLRRRLTAQAANQN